MHEHHNRARSGAADPKPLPASRCLECGGTPVIHPLLGFLTPEHSTTCRIARRGDRRIAADLRASRVVPEQEAHTRRLDPAEIDDIDVFAIDVPLPSTEAEQARWAVYVDVWEEDGQRHVMRGFSRDGRPVGVLIDSSAVRR